MCRTAGATKFFLPQATASIGVKEEFGDVNCFFLRVAEVVFKVRLLLIWHGCSRQKGQKLQKAATSLFVQRDAVPAAALSESGVCNISAERGTNPLKSNKLRKASYFSTANAPLLSGWSILWDNFSGSK